MKPQSFIINALIAVLVLAVIAWYAHSIRVKRREASEMKAIMERFADGENPIRDRDTMLLAARGRKTDGMIGYAPFRFHDMPVALMLHFPPEFPARPSMAQLAAYDILLDEYDDGMAEDILLAAHDHAMERTAGGVFGEEGHAPADEEDALERFLETMSSPVRLSLQPTERDGVAFVTFCLVVGVPPVRYEIRVHGGNIVDVRSVMMPLEADDAGPDFSPAVRTGRR